jgi:uncharacterized protein with GYD domain
MIFVTTLDLIPGKNDDLRKIIKNLKVPNDIKIKEFLSLFGKPDYLVIFDAPNEERAMDFVLKFASVTVPKTALGFPVDNA